MLGGGLPSWLRFPLALSSKPSESMGIEINKLGLGRVAVRAKPVGIHY
ncbi:hypothetical protein XYCOK13_43640 [Xylanibacillus composti]|uniref:Uncharacterized protein n=1 Tax=Xylanibacillus composti TaxID=1572762 RepID=A0A8J4M4S0_9BACL|nr:hypothetical protein XYCOK13_43640 [Xylanibacillus composti]